MCCNLIYACEAPLSKENYYWSLIQVQLSEPKIKNKKLTCGLKEREYNTS